jgi:PAS domain S-box-containing protein
VKDAGTRPSVRQLVAPALLGEAAECAELAISVYDDHGKYVAVNEHACRLLGYDREELVTHDVADFTAGGIDRSVLRDAHRREGVRLVTRKDGSKVPVAFVVAQTRIMGVAFYVSVWWELDPDDPRASGAT